MTQTTIQIKEPKAPATEPQIKFLESLIAERECPSVAERYAFAKGFLTKGAASTLIGEAKAAPKKAVKPVAIVDDLSGQAAAVMSGKQEAIKTALTECPAFGYYEIDGTVYYWDVTGKDSFPTLRKLVKLTQWNGSVKGSWKKIPGSYASPKVSVTFVPYNGKGYIKTEVTKTVTVPGIFAVSVMDGAKPMSMEQAAAQGKMMGFCIRCGATLTDPESVAAGIGPVCKTYWY